MPEFKLILSRFLAIVLLTCLSVNSIYSQSLSVNVSTTPATCGISDGTVTITATGIPPYTYSVGGIVQNSGYFTGLRPGLYSLEVSDGKSSYLSSVSITTQSPPLITAYTVSHPFGCKADGVVTLRVSSGTPPYEYSLELDANYQATNVFAGLAPGDYEFYVKDANGCIGSTKVALVDNNCPIVVYAWAYSSAVYCDVPGFIGISGVTGGTPPYEFSLDGINYQSSGNFNNLPPGVYTVYIQDAAGLTKIMSIQMLEGCRPDFSYVSAVANCKQNDGALTITGSYGTPPYTYSIDGINYQAGNVFSNLASGIYTVTLKDAINRIVSKEVAVNDNCPLTAVATNATCSNNNGGIVVSASNGIPPYQYSIDGIHFQAGNSFSGLAAGPYTVWSMDATGKMVSQTVVVSITDNLSFTPGNDPTICEGTNTVLNCTSNGNNFSWSPAAGLSNNSILHPVASPMVTTKYYVTASLGVCTKKDSVTVFVNPAPVAHAGNGSTICYGKTARLGGAGGLSYNWTPGTYLSNASIADPEVVRPSSTITYSLTVTDGNGCRSLQPSRVTIAVQPPLKVFAGNDTSIVMDQPFPLQAIDIDNIGFTQYEWSPAYGLNNSAVKNPVAMPDRNTTYTVTATNAQGCSGVGKVNIKVYRGPDIYVANAFSPNGDGRNDVLKAVAVGIKEFKYFNIYNRWGQLIFSTKDAARGWNGEVSHAAQGSDTFVWIAEGVDGKGNSVKRRGSVVLVR
jgi:gliding motility-associated-like protein